MSDRPVVRPVSLVERVLTTAAVPVLVLLADQVPLAYVDAGALARAKAHVSPFAAGLGPFIMAYGLVELVALVVPRFRRARHDARGRAWLERVAGALAVGLALVQGWGIANSIEGVDLATGLGWEPRAVQIATIAAGSCLMALAARWTTRRGLVNGYVLWWTLPVVIDLVRGDAFRMAALRGGTHSVVLLTVALAIAIGVTSIAVAGGDSQVAAARVDGSAYRGDQARAPRAWLPVPASSIQPVTAASSVLMLPAVLATWNLPGARELQRVLERGDAAFEVGYFAVLVGFTLVAAALLHRPAEMAAFVRRLGPIDEETARADARASLRRALPPTLAYLVAVALASYAMRGASSAAPSSVMLAIATAGVVDLARSLAVHVRARDLVCVAEERDAYGVAALRGALAAEGIDARPRGMAALSLLQAFGPYAPVELYVRAADADRAAALLRHWAAGEPKQVAPQVRPVPAGWVPWSPVARTGMLAALGAAALAADLAPAPDFEPPGAPARRAEIALVYVDDGTDPLATASDDTPEGVTIYVENAPAGPGRTTRTHYARVVPRDGETNAAAWERVQPWLQQFPILPDHRWAWEAVTEPVQPASDDEPRTWREVGLRTLLLTGPPVVTTRDVSFADVNVDPQNFDQVYVLVTLSPQGAIHFHQATSEWVGRRMAIVVDGHVDSAPVIRSPIAGGRLTITMGAGEPDKQLAEARALAAALR